jgi:LemA protein
LQFARRYYNGSVRDNNNLVEGFPSLIIAKLFRFVVAVFFEIELASQRAAPKVRLETT